MTSQDDLLPVGLEVSEIRNQREGTYHTLLRVTYVAEKGKRSVAGTLFGHDAPRLVELAGVNIEAALESEMMYIVNEDTPGFIGRIGSLLGDHGINIGNFNLGRRAATGEAVLLLSVDQPIGQDVIDAACKLESVKRVKGLSF